MFDQREPKAFYPSNTVATAKQAIVNLFHWKQHIQIINDHGEQVYVWKDPEPLQNPIQLLRHLNAKAWLFFLVGFAAWTADAFDFHSLSIQTVKLAQYYETSKTKITTAITLTLLLRSVGAALFGLAGDRYGRKYPMVINMVVLGALQVATIYSSTFAQFLAVRSLFGLFMGGVYGNAIAMALENCPLSVRGLISGILQQGYSFGYVLAACVNLGVGGDTQSWKIVFWAGAGFSFLIGLVRLAIPESYQLIHAKAAGHKDTTIQAFCAETRTMLQQEWHICIYCIILMTWFNYYSHTSQDSYTTFLLTEKELSNAPATRASIIMKTGACVGGTIIGYLSQWIGRRRAMIISALISCLLVPAWILPTDEGALSTSGFLMQFFVQGAWGVIPIHLSELSPPAFRSVFVGVTYQIGNMISSPSAQLVNAISESHFLTAPSGDRVEAYGPTMGVATVVIALGIVFTVAIGPERMYSHFEATESAVVEHEEALHNDRREWFLKTVAQRKSVSSPLDALSIRQTSANVQCP